MKSKQKKQTKQKFPRREAFQKYLVIFQASADRYTCLNQLPKKWSFQVWDSLEVPMGSKFNWINREAALIEVFN